MGRDPEYLAFARLMSAALADQAEHPTTVTAERERLADSVRRLPRPAVASVRDLTVDGGDGPLPARLYRPADTAAGPGPAALPGLVYFHGGGFYLGDVESWDATCRTLANATGVALLSVEYRLAPEHPFPAAVEDAHAATRWAAAHAADLDIDRLGVGGDSAGATLAAVAAQRAYDDGLALALQLLVYGVYDLTRPRAAVVDPDGLTMSDGPAQWEVTRARYLAGADPAHPWASPALRADLGGLAPAVVAWAEYDPLRRDGEEYAAALRAAGVPVSTVPGTGLDHAYLAWGAYSATARAAITEIGSAVRGMLPPAAVNRDR